MISRSVVAQLWLISKKTRQAHKAARKVKRQNNLIKPIALSDS
jgi:hypothetical protein